MAEIYHRDNCRLCGSKELTLVLKLAPTPIADAYVSAERAKQDQPLYPMDIFLCRSCGLSQMLDVINPETLYRDYIYVTTSSLGLLDHFESTAEDILSRIKPEKGSRVVDIGSNDGTLLRHFKKRGMNVLGVEPASEIALAATKSGVETLPLFFDKALGKKIRQERGAAKIITMNNLMANIDDLSDMVGGLRELLDSDGVFIFESYYLPDLIENMVFDFLYHEHLSSFSVKPIQSFFKRNGMELIDVQRIPTKGGSLRYTAQLAGGPRPVSPMVTELLKLEETRGIHQPEVFKTFAKRIDKAREELAQQLKEIRAKGKSVAGYGASATTTTMIYHFNITDQMDFIVDDNPAKQNTFSPGCHIPVLSSQAIYEKKPDYLLVLAWRYYQPIVKKHQTFLAQGGQFIVPLPKLQIL
jgi:SAM-dependent methyltransferase